MVRPVLAYGVGEVHLFALLRSVYGSRSLRVLVEMDGIELLQAVISGSIASWAVHREKTRAAGEIHASLVKLTSDRSARCGRNRCSAGTEFQNTNRAGSRRG